MPRKHSPEFRQAVLARLAANHNNVPLTAQQLHVPERTLYRWRRHAQQQHPTGPFMAKKNVSLWQVPPQNPESGGLLPAHPAPPATNDEESSSAHMVPVYRALRARLLEHIETLSEQLTAQPEHAARNIIALSRLLDRVIRMQEIISLAERNQPVLIRFHVNAEDVRDPGLLKPPPNLPTS